MPGVRIQMHGEHSRGSAVQFGIAEEFRLHPAEDIGEKQWRGEIELIDLAGMKSDEEFATAAGAGRRSRTASACAMESQRARARKISDESSFTCLARSPVVRT